MFPLIGVSTPVIDTMTKKQLAEETVCFCLPLTSPSPREARAGTWKQELNRDHWGTGEECCLLALYPGLAQLLSYVT